MQHFSLPYARSFFNARDWRGWPPERYPTVFVMPGGA
jgi:hypothetical protein